MGQGAAGALSAVLIFKLVVGGTEPQAAWQLAAQSQSFLVRALLDFFSRTPAPLPPSSGMNSTPAASKVAAGMDQRDLTSAAIFVNIQRWLRV